MATDLNETLVFVKVAEHGSFISAARALRLPKTTVSRKVQQLEARLGAQLLHRTTRKLALTEAGAIYFEHSRRIAQDLDEAESAVGQLQGGPRGWLRFTAPYDIGINWIAPLLGEFRTRYPELRVEMVLSNEPVDIIDQAFDVALRVGSLPDSTLVARRLAVLHTQIYAAPGYVARYGEPRHPDDLQHHRTLAMQKHRHNGSYAWSLGDGDGYTHFRIDPVLVANDIGALTSALISGEGLMLTCDVTLKPHAEGGCVERVLSDWTGPDLDLSALFPHGKVQSPKIRAFVDFLVERLRFDVDYMQTKCPGRAQANGSAKASASGTAERARADGVPA